MEIQESNTIIFNTSRVFGLAPYLIRRTPKGRIDGLALSIRLSGYSVSVLLALVILTVRGLIVDANSTSPVRMTTSTSKFVTSFDVIVVVGACLFGVICGIVGLRYTQEMNDKLREVDDTLAKHTDRAKDRRKDVIMLVSVFVVMTAMIAMDLVSRYRILNRVVPDDIFDVASSNVCGYIPFYILYFMLMALHAQFAQSALGIGRRYRRLNNALQLAFPIAAERRNKINQPATPTPKKTSTVHIIRVGSLRTHDDQPVRRHTNGSNQAEPKKPIIVTPVSRDAADETLPPAITSDNVAETLSESPTSSLTKGNHLVDRLAGTHALLGETVGNVSGAYGAALLAMLVSCLLHLVATSYFLFVEILGANDLFFSMLQFLWMFFHVTRLLLIVEPCHIASVEAHRTIILVCEIIRNNKDEQVVFSLKKFWRQLLAERSYYFSACGMCNIDRQILTSISGAIATYLVILIQFQKSDG